MKKKSIKQKSLGTELIKSIEKAIENPLSVKTVRSSISNDPIATSIEVDDTNLWVFLADGRSLGVPLVYFPRLLNAKKKDFKKFELSGGGRGIHWKTLDEDISVKGLLLGFADQTKLGRTLL